jgi:signal transduction histidine kinase
MPTRSLVVLGGLGAVSLGCLVWAIVYTQRPSTLVVLGLMTGVVGLAVGPWTRVVARRLRGEGEADRVQRRVVEVTILAVVVSVGVTLAVCGDSRITSYVAIVAIFTAGALGLLGAVVLPWVFLLARTLSRERMARVRAEERAEMAAHLHDSVLQSLILIHRRTDDPDVRRLARGTERELRAWLFGTDAKSGDDLVSAVTAVCGEVEDLFAITVDLVLVGNCPLDARVRAVVGALREALTNAAKHSGATVASALVEVADGEMFVLVRDRGCGFDLPVRCGERGRGLVDSIQGRMRQQGGLADIRSAVGDGTEVELRMPVGT